MLVCITRAIKKKDTEEQDLTKVDELDENSRPENKAINFNILNTFLDTHSLLCLKGYIDSIDSITSIRYSPLYKNVLFYSFFCKNRQNSSRMEIFSNGGTSQ